ncbi:phosphate acetyltransferase [Mycoplasmopsis alligatoris]|uniref:Phosphate acetyltransferase n=1 Tax=Mycoplasmopsis alligatoris A21JP2 TaxID=747682 RepID=D4XV74_9BACT|nr:phosphate acetyltransferase [Mycoplasmopsis alligatoris]EFF41753.1 phosphate acetyltransferase [Mycoplasmopsis alligatoris A21JP2]
MKFTDLLNQKIENIKELKHIVLIDGDDERSLKAYDLLKKYKNLKVTLLTEKSQEDTSRNYLNIFEDQKLLEEYMNEYVTLRKGKETYEMAQKFLSTRPFYAMMMLHKGLVHGVVGGLNYSTADILRAAFKVIGPKAGIKTISSVMIMHKDENVSIFSDISVNPKPTKEQLSDIGLNAAEFTKQLGFDPRVAFLSFSTDGSALNDDTKMVKEATLDFNTKWDGTKAIGEVQLDAAIDLEIRKAKYKSESYDQVANTLIFPDLNAGNIGYKLVQRFANYGAIGPVVVGTKKPVNDLSRGSKVEDVVNTVLITMLQAQGAK